MMALCRSRYLWAGFERKVRIGSDANIQNVIGLAQIIRDFESQRRRELIVSVGRRCVASRAALLPEDELAPARVLVEFVRIGRRSQRGKIESQRVELFIAVSSSFFCAKGCWAGLEVAEMREYIKALV